MVNLTTYPGSVILFDPDDSQPDYIGITYGETDTGTDKELWRIYKFTYDGLNTTEIKRKDNVAWTQRATLDW